MVNFAEAVEAAKNSTIPDFRKSYKQSQPIGRIRCFEANLAVLENWSKTKDFTSKVSDK